MSKQQSIKFTKNLQRTVKPQKCIHGAYLYSINENQNSYYSVYFVDLHEKYKRHFFDNGQILTIENTERTNQSNSITAPKSLKKKCIILSNVFDPNHAEIW